MWRATTLVLVACLTLTGVSSAQAQGGGGRGGHGPGGGPGGGGPGGGVPGGGGRALDAAANVAGNQLNQNNINNLQMAQAMQNQNQNQTQQNMPTISQLATSLMTTYDTNNSGSLDVTELQAALAGLRSMLMSNNQQNGNAGVLNAGMMNPGALNQQDARPPRRR